MEIIKSRYQALIKALATLGEAIQIINDPEYRKIYKSLRDSAIQRFEYSIDNFWKFLKLYLQEKSNVPLETATPRIILREAVNSNIISEKEYMQLIESITDRNLTSHSYNENIAELLVKKIPDNYLLMQNIIQRLSV